MILFPNAKINLGLNVTEKRPDGFHNLESVFYPVNWCDALELLPAETTEFTSSGIEIPGNPASNLCLKAYALLKADFDIPAVKMHLHKHIPIGAGLGGGSADAAFTLKGLNELFALHLSPEQLENYARQLGADCAFFIRNQPVYAYNKGDEFEPVQLDLKGHAIAIVYPEIHITTAEAYGKIKPKPAEFPVKGVIGNAMETWPKTLTNDFETALFPAYPILPELKKQLYAAGATYAAMTGSGSAVFGIFKTEIPAALRVREDFRTWRGLL